MSDINDTVTPQSDEIGENPARKYFSSVSFRPRALRSKGELGAVLGVFLATAVAAVVVFGPSNETLTELAVDIPRFLGEPSEEEAELQSRALGSPTSTPADQDVPSDRPLLGSVSTTDLSTVPNAQAPEPITRPSAVEEQREQPLSAELNIRNAAPPLFAPPSIAPSQARIQADLTIDARRTTTTTAPQRPATTSAPRTEDRPTTSSAPRATTSTSTTTSAPQITTTTTAAPPPPLTPANVPAGNAGPSGSQGCRGACPQVGFQNLDGKNGVVLENVTISNPGGRCISLNNAHNITIRNVTITNCGTNQAIWDHYDAGLVEIRNSSNITIENSLISNISARHFSAARNNAIQSQNSHDIRIRNNEFRDIHSDIGQRENDVGNRAISIQGSGTWNVTIDNNRFYNAGRNALQVKDVRNAGGMSFSNNIVEGRGPWNSDYEDMVNLFSSSGTSGSPIRIAGNFMRNGGPSTNGTAIIVGDGNSSRGATQFVLVEDNVIIDPGNVGINVAGGDHTTVRNNVVYASANTRYFESVGFIINHFHYSTHCYNHTIHGNRVWFRNQHHGSGVNHLWNTNTCGVNLFDNVFGDESLHGLFG